MSKHEYRIWEDACALYAGGWRSNEREWFQEEYELEEDEAIEIAYHLLDIEKNMAQSANA